MTGNLTKWHRIAEQRHIFELVLFSTAAVYGGLIRFTRRCRMANDTCDHGGTSNPSIDKNLQVNGW